MSILFHPPAQSGAVMHLPVGCQQSLKLKEEEKDPISEVFG